MGLNDRDFIRENIYENKIGKESQRAGRTVRLGRRLTSKCKNKKREVGRVHPKLPYSIRTVQQGQKGAPQAKVRGHRSTTSPGRGPALVAPSSAVTD